MQSITLHLIFPMWLFLIIWPVYFVAHAARGNVTFLMLKWLFVHNWCNRIFEYSFTDGTGLHLRRRLTCHDGFSYRTRKFVLPCCKRFSVDSTLERLLEALQSYRKISNWCFAYVLLLETLLYQLLPRRLWINFLSHCFDVIYQCGAAAILLV